MNPQEILDRLEEGQGAANLVPRSQKVPGLGAAFFARISTYYGTENTKLRRLGRHWRSLLTKVDDPAWIYRGGGGYERAVGHWTASAAAFISAGNAATDPVSHYAFQLGATDSLARPGPIEEPHRLAQSITKNLNKL